MPPAEKQFLNEYATPTRTHFLILFLSWAGWLFDFYDLILYSFLLVPISRDLNLTDMQSSVVLGASLAMTALGGIMFGYLADKWGRRPILQLTILTYSVGTFFSGFAHSLPGLLFWRSVTGLGVGGEWATGQTYIGETFPPRMRGRYGAFMQTGAPLGIALASVMGGFFAPHFGWRLAFQVSVLPALLVIFVRRWLPESDIWLEKELIHKSGLLSEAEKSKYVRGPFRQLLAPDLRKLFFSGLTLTIFDMSAYWYTYSWLPGYLHKQRGFSLAKSSEWILITQLGGFLGYFTFGFVADWLGRRPAYSIYSVIMAVGLLMITIFWGAVAQQPGVILFFMFIVGFGTGMFGGYGPLFSEIFPTRVRNTASGTAFNLARGVQFFTPMVIALVARKYGLSGGISLAALFALLTGAWIWVLPETKGKTIAAV